MGFDPAKLAKLIADIKQKKELRSIDSEFVKENLLRYLQQYPSFDFNPKSALYKKIIKEIRARLRRSYGLFRQEKIDWSSDPESILKQHSSTKERFSFYPELYSRVWKITGKPKVILDLACGVNPFSVQFMGLKDVHYYASDLNEEEIKQINLFFKKQNILGEASVLNLLNFSALGKLPSADVAFLFKIVDILDERKGHKNSEAVIKALPAKYVVVSFSTLTMSGKKMNAPRRRWMEWMCKRLGYEYHILEFENELFYVISKVS